MTKTMNALDLLDSGNFQTYNREVARVLKSVNSAILLSELINRYNYHSQRGELVSYLNHPGDWFYYTVDKCEERTCLSPAEQKTAIKILESYGFFLKKAIGLPAKRHFQINIDKIIEFIIGSKNISSSAKSTEQDERNSPNTIGENNSANKELYEDPEVKKKETPSSVVVFHCIDELNISMAIREKIISRFDESDAKLLVTRVVNYSGRENDAHGVNTIMKHWDTWGDVLSQEEITKRNDIFLSKCPLKDRMDFNNHLVSIGNKSSGKYIEFVCGNIVKHFMTDEKNFIQDLVDYATNRLNLDLNDLAQEFS